MKLSNIIKHLDTFNSVALTNFEKTDDFNSMIQSILTNVSSNPEILNDPNWDYTEAEIVALKAALNRSITDQDFLFNAILDKMIAENLKIFNTLSDENVTLANVLEFLQLVIVIENLGQGFHPDDDFNDYVDGNGNKMFTVETAEHYNNKMNLYADWCEIHDIDIYQLSMDINSPVINSQTEEEKSNMVRMILSPHLNNLRSLNTSVVKMLLTSLLNSVSGLNIIVANKSLSWNFAESSEGIDIDAAESLNEFLHSRENYLEYLKFVEDFPQIKDEESIYISPISLIQMTNDVFNFLNANLSPNIKKFYVLPSIDVRNNIPTIEEISNNISLHNFDEYDTLTYFRGEILADKTVEFYEATLLYEDGLFRVIFDVTESVYKWDAELELFVELSGYLDERAGIADGTDGWGIYDFLYNLVVEETVEETVGESFQDLTEIDITGKVILNDITYNVAITRNEDNEDKLLVQFYLVNQFVGDVEIELSRENTEIVGIAWTLPEYQQEIDPDNVLMFSQELEILINLIEWSNDMDDNEHIGISEISTDSKQQTTTDTIDSAVQEFVDFMKNIGNANAEIFYIINSIVVAGLEGGEAGLFNYVKANVHFADGESPSIIRGEIFENTVIFYECFLYVNGTSFEFTYDDEAGEFKYDAETDTFIEMSGYLDERAEIDTEDNWEMRGYLKANMSNLSNTDDDYQYVNDGFEDITRDSKEAAIEEFLDFLQNVGNPESVEFFVTNSELIPDYLNSREEYKQFIIDNISFKEGNSPSIIRGEIVDNQITFSECSLYIENGKYNFAYNMDDGVFVYDQSTDTFTEESGYFDERVDLVDGEDNWGIIDFIKSYIIGSEDDLING